MGPPDKELYVMLGIKAFQQMFALLDDEASCQVMFN
jgi:hypothetical protein